MSIAGYDRVRMVLRDSHHAPQSDFGAAADGLGDLNVMLHRFERMRDPAQGRHLHRLADKLLSRHHKALRGVVLLQFKNHADFGADDEGAGGGFRDVRGEAARRANVIGEIDHIGRAFGMHDERRVRVFGFGLQHVRGRDADMRGAKSLP